MPSKRGSVRVCWIYEALKQGTTPRSNIPSSSYASTRGQNRLLSFRRKDASFSGEAFRERLICGALLHSSCSMRVQGVGFGWMAARQTRQAIERSFGLLCSLGQYLSSIELYQCCSVCFDFFDRHGQTEVVQE